jgi:glycine/D-amino acid oxidase-like deaminating enzyme
MAKTSHFKIVILDVDPGKHFQTPDIERDVLNEYAAVALIRTNSPETIIAHVEKAIYIPDEGSIETAQLFTAYDAILNDTSNIHLIAENAVRINILERQGLKEVTTASGERLLSPNVVICAGAYSQRLIDQIPEIVPHIPRLLYGTGVGLHVESRKEMPDRHFELPDKVIRTTARGFACGIHLVPYDQYRCYIGSTNLNLNVEVAKPQVAQIHDLLRSAIKEVSHHFATTFFEMVIGHRPTSSDLYPLLGATSIEGLWIVSGTRREGFFLSPVLSQSIANEVVNKPSLTPACFKPERDHIHDLTGKRESREPLSIPSLLNMAVVWFFHHRKRTLKGC